MGEGRSHRRRAAPEEGGSDPASPTSCLISRVFMSKIEGGEIRDLDNAWD